MTQTIEIENIGPVTHATIPVPESGGIVVLKGRNGAGKTRTLAAVENLVSGRGKPTVRDGALSGSVNGLGVSLKLARSARRTGELEVMSLEGKLSVAELVDPGLKSPEAADAKRIKALIQVAGIEPKPSVFYDLFGGREAFESIASSAAVESGDLVSMADRIKRDCEAEARKLESSADHQEGRARGATEAAGDVDANTAPPDEKALHDELMQAVESLTKLKEQSDAHQRAADNAELAQLRLEKAKAAYSGSSVAEAMQTESLLLEMGNAQIEMIQRLQESLNHARAELAVIQSKCEAATNARKAAEQYEESIASWQEQISQDVPPKPSQEQIDAAGERVTAVKAALSQVAVLKSALAKHGEAAMHASQALAYRKQAAELRAIARGTDEVLSAAVAKLGTPLRVEAGRLVITTKRGDTYFGDLSNGEQWRIALDVAIEAVGANGMIVVKQEAWEGLDPFARREIADHVKGRGVVILTAECSADDHVTAEVFGE